MEEKFYKVSEVEEMLSVSKSTLKRWIKSKKLRATKFGDDVEGNPWRISATDLAAFKKKHSHSNTEGQ
jgi:excisionase family DNA binding protein